MKTIEHDVLYLDENDITIHAKYKLDEGLAYISHINITSFPFEIMQAIRKATLVVFIYKQEKRVIKSKY